MARAGYLSVACAPMANPDVEAEDEAQQVVQLLRTGGTGLRKHVETDVDADDGNAQAQGQITQSDFPFLVAVTTDSGQSQTAGQEGNFAAATLIIP